MFEKPTGMRRRPDAHSYDPKSVMNYCNTTYNNDGVLSPRDVASVQQIYGSRK